MNKTCTIHVVEDDVAMRDSVVALLEDAGYRVRAFASAEELLALGVRAEPGCVVSDVRMPGTDGLSLLRQLRAQGAALPLVIITGHGDVPLAVAAMKAGAVDFLEKPFGAEALLSAVEAGLQARRSGQDPAEVAAARRRLTALTAHELDVLRHLADGDSNKAVAAKLDISPRTVEFHRANIMDRTGAKSLPDLIRLWIVAHQAA